MANQLDDENKNLIRHEGKDIHVVDRQIPITVGIGSLIFEIFLWCSGIIPGLIFNLFEHEYIMPIDGIALSILKVFIWCSGIIPGLIFLFCKISAANHLRRLEQKLNHDASQIDNYLEQRVIILSNAAKLLDRAIKLDQETMLNVASIRSGIHKGFNGQEMSQFNDKINDVTKKINFVFENYPDLKAHQEIREAMQQNDYLQKEITAAREQYNDTVNAWNRDIQTWPAKMIVAARNGYTTKIPFIAAQEIKDKAKKVFF